APAERRCARSGATRAPPARRARARRRRGPATVSASRSSILRLMVHGAIPGMLGRAEARLRPPSPFALDTLRRRVIRRRAAAPARPHAGAPASPRSRAGALLGGGGAAALERRRRRQTRHFEDLLLVQRLVLEQRLHQRVHRLGMAREQGL